METWTSARDPPRVSEFLQETRVFAAQLITLHMCNQIQDVPRVQQRPSVVVLDEALHSNAALPVLTMALSGLILFKRQAVCHDLGACFS